MILSSIDKAMRVLDLLGKYPGGLRLKEMSVLGDMSQSSIHHILSTIMPYGYIQQDEETKKYSLGFRFVSISQIIVDNMEIRDISHKHLEELGNKLKGVAHVSVLKNNKLVYVDKSDRSEGLHLATYIGYTTEAYATAGGKVFLSRMDESKIREMYKHQTFHTFTPKTIQTVDDLCREVDEVRKRGYALDDEEYYEGVRCIAVPITIHGEMLAALSLTTSVFDYTKKQIENDVRYHLLETAQTISQTIL